MSGDLKKHIFANYCHFHVGIAVGSCDGLMTHMWVA
jgi:hypothetical protein